MDLALYHPRHGFYTKGPIIGRPNGQFNTNAMYHAFAFTLYLAIQQAEDTLGEQLRIVEFGGGTGELAANILSYFPSARDYVIVETSPALRTLQRQRGLRSIEKADDLDPAPTFVLGNEVLDALPVHRVMGDGSGHLLELYVGVGGDGELIEWPDSPSTPLLAERLQGENISLGRGQVAEICLELESFLRAIAKLISKGWLVLIDYGDEAEQVYSYQRRNGTLRSFRAQRQTFDPFDYVGEQDLTADVDFTALQQAAGKVGLNCATRMRQGTWLKCLGIDRYADHVQDRRQAESEIEQLTSMARLGSSFDVHVFRTKDLPDWPSLHFV
ncbi:MAG: SAM-dependent methyltransferase [Nitrospirales bacterium]|nr:SAM-dependent methyltransferase [Nitrospira sp.]MDR4500824.1 SAM-dependent methyltransferase [Nitrospirales bacterium]